MDNSFLKDRAERCRSLADKADAFTRRRLLDLAEKYEDRLGIKKPLSSGRLLQEIAGDPAKITPVPPTSLA